MINKNELGQIIIFVMPNETFEDIRGQMVKASLERNKWRKNKTAIELDADVKTIRSLIKKHGITKSW